MQNVKLQEKRKELEKKVNEKALKYHNVFSSHLGKEVLRDLRTEFAHGELSDKDPNVTIMRAHQRDVYDYISRLVLRGESIKDAS